MLGLTFARGKGGDRKYLLLKYAGVMRSPVIRHRVNLQIGPIHVEASRLTRLTAQAMPQTSLHLAFCNNGLRLAPIPYRRGGCSREYFRSSPHLGYVHPRHLPALHFWALVKAQQQQEEEEKEGFGKKSELK